MQDEKIIFCKGGGCTAKLGPAALSRVLSKLPKFDDKNLIVGFDSSDDAAVYKLTDDIAIVQTLDFFPPMVSDPRTFGRIAATNSLSDVYAMGGVVKTALNIVCFPESEDMNILGEILLGGSEKVREAGGVLSGGHSIADTDIKYGLSVTGVVHPDKVLRNNTCRPGDKLILTKPLGVGLITTASRVDAVSKEDMDGAIKSMTTLNKYAAEVFGKYNVHGCTDITGFGFLGHLAEMIGGSHTAIIDSSAVPTLPKARYCAEEFLITAAAQRTRNFMGDIVDFTFDDFAMEEILFDPQTSGGLLAAVAPEDAERALEDIKALGMPCGMVGVIEDGGRRIIVK